MNLDVISKDSHVYKAFSAMGEIFLLWIVIIAKVFAFNKYIGNELDVLPSARQFFDSSWLPNDWYLNLDIGYRQVFNYFFGLLVNWLGFLNGAYIGRLIVYLLLAFALFIFFRAINLRFSLGLIVVVVFLGNQSLIAGEWIAGGADPKTLAYAFALLSFALFYKKKYLIGFAFAGAALSFHVLIGIYALVCTIVAILFTHGSRRQNWMALVRQSWPLFITGFFGFLAIFQQLLPQGEIDASKAWKIYVEFRVPHHVLPSAWQGDLWVNELILATCLFLSIYLIIKKGSLKFTAAYALGCVSLFTIGLVIFAIGQTSLLRFYWFRYPDVMIPFLSLVLVALVISDLTYTKPDDSPRRNKRWYGVQLLLSKGLPLFLAMVLILIAFQSITIIRASYRRGTNRRPTKIQTSLEWISENTPRHAVFLVDALMSEFYVFAERPRFVSFNHSPQSAADILEWYERIELSNGDQSF
ncbi:MAG: hypothetical protein KAS38_11960, partial [Anaerolineales bacterium]|nr:hypothetical protein [Anaerolineales bacterium]